MTGNRTEGMYSHQIEEKFLGKFGTPSPVYELQPVLVSGDDATGLQRSLEFLFAYFYGVR